MTVDPNTQENRPREEIMKLLQMRDCSNARDTSTDAKKVRDALCKKLWLEKNSGEGS